MLVSRAAMAPLNALSRLSMAAEMAAASTADRGRLEPEQRQELRLQLRTDVRVLPEEQPRILAALADALLAEREPGAAFLDHALLEREVDQLALVRDALVVDDVEFRLAERGG